MYDESILVVSPTNPKMLISVPITGLTVTPNASSSPVNFFISSLLVFGFKITTIKIAPLFFSYKFQVLSDKVMDEIPLGISLIYVLETLQRVSSLNLSLITFT